MGWILFSTLGKISKLLHLGILTDKEIVNKKEKNNQHFFIVLPGQIPILVQYFPFFFNIFWGGE